MHQTQATESSVFDLYRNYPFPQTTPEMRRAILPYQIAKYRALGVEEAWKGRVLDVGCGTGRTMAVPKHYGPKLYVGIDQSEVSLNYAKGVAADEGVAQFRPIATSLFEMPFPDDTFDLAVCWGVLHCTPDPVRGLKEMIRVCKPGGFVAFFVFNPFAHWRHDIQRWRVRRGAKSAEMREQVLSAHRLYGSKPIEQMAPQEMVEFVDRYCVPIESKHSYAELLSWFDKLGVEYWGSSPPLRMREFVGYMQALSDLQESLPSQRKATSLHRLMGAVADISKRLPSRPRGAGPSKRPSWFHRTFWQTLLAWNGRRSDQSVGASFCARKPLRS